MKDKIERKRLLILQTLRRAGNPVSSRIIQDQLRHAGLDISERTVRFHLHTLDEEGLTEYIEKKGRRLTALGRTELERSRIYEQVGFLSARIDQLTYRMDFNLRRRTGSVVVNTSLIQKDSLAKVCPLIRQIFESGYSMGRLLALFEPGETVGEYRIPPGYAGIGTVCSITLNGVLLEAGIPITSIFGGLLEVVQGRPDRFAAIIKYDGTTLDPLEIYIRSGMTNYTGLVEENHGLVGASFREIPAAARDQVEDLAGRLEEAGLGRFLEMGWPGQSLLGIPMADGRSGMIVPGGLNAVGILEEQGIDIRSKALSGLVDYARLFPYPELEERVQRL